MKIFKCVWLIDYIVLRLIYAFYLHGDLNIAVEGLQHLDRSLLLIAYEQGHYRATPAVTQGLGFAFSFEGPLSLVEYYDKQGILDTM